MLIPFRELMARYKLNISSILHVGAHECEELTDYEKYITRERILWIEALPGKVRISQIKYPNVRIVNAIVSDTIEKIRFNVSNNGQSSSILEFGLHSKFHPEVHYVTCFEGETKLLKDILDEEHFVPNFLNFDIQGAELKALKGMHDYLKYVDYIYTEVNSDYVYKDCALVGELDEYLSTFGFVRVETKWTPFQWGDAFYIKGGIVV